MTNSLRKLAKDLKAFAKRCKDFKYTEQALFVFLLCGIVGFADVTTAPTDKAIQNQRQEITTSIGDMRQQFRRVKSENDKLMKNYNLELIQLMEQGDHVVKSPWSSWQYGINTFYNDWRGTYKGKGNKIKDNGVYKRSQTLSRYLESPVIEKNANNTTTLGFVYEPNAEIPISASITPKSISKTNPNIQKNVAIASLPSFEPRVVVEPVAPKVTAPDPNIDIQLSITSNSRGSGEEVRAFAPNGNAPMESIALKGGDIIVNRTGNSSHTYKTSGGVTPIAIKPSTISVTTTLGSGITLGSAAADNTYNSSGNNGFFQANGDHHFGVTLNSSNITYTVDKTFNDQSHYAELVHQDVHGGATSTQVDAALSTANILGLDSKVFSEIYNTNAFSTTATKPNSYNVFANAGIINISGEKAIAVHSYNHNGGNGVVVNAGTINLNKRTDGETETQHAMFLISKHSQSNNNNQHYYNTETGTVATNTDNTAMFLFVPSTDWNNNPNGVNSHRHISITNKGSMSLNGKNSVGIFTNNGDIGTDIHLNFSTATSAGTQTQITDHNQSSNNSKYVNTLTGGIVSKDSARGTNGVTKASKVMTINSNKSAGLYMPNKNSFINGQFAVELTNIASSSSDGSAGIYSNSDVDLQGHYIKVGGTNNVGVYPVGDGSETIMYLGKGTVEVNGGSKNSGIVVKANSNNTGRGRVYSESEMVMEGGTNNTAIYVGGHSGGNENDVTIKSLETDTTSQKDTVFIYSENAGKVKTDANAGGLSVIGEISSGDPEFDSTTGKVSKTVGAAYAKGQGTVIDISQATGNTFGTGTATPTRNYNIDIKGAQVKDSATSKMLDMYTGFGLFAEGGAKIQANNNKVKAEDTGAAIASKDTNSKVVLDGGEVYYKGSGFALFAKDGGEISLQQGKLTLDGKATGFSVDYSVSSQPINLTGTAVNIDSDDAILMSVKNATNLNTTGMGTNLLSKVSLTPASIGGSATRYKYAVLDGANINVDGDIDKADTTSTSDSYIFTRRIQLQNSNINVLSGKTVKAHLASADLTTINPDLTVPVGLDVSASENSWNTTTTGVNVANGATITVDRTDSGNGGVGAYVNYGTVTNDGKIEVEKLTPNDHAVGIYATNGTVVNNNATGTVEVGGKDSIGILGLSYRIDSKNNVVYEKFSTGGVIVPNGIGHVDITNKGKITLDGDNALGIYAKNNSLDATGVNAGYLRSSTSNTSATNDGEITLAGKNAIGMITEGGKITNDSNGKITINGQEGVAMYGTVAKDSATPTVNKVHSQLINKGTITLADTTATTPIIGMFTNDPDTSITTSGTINVGKKSYGVYGASNNVSMTGGAINVGDDGVGIFATGSSDTTTPTPTSTVNLSGGTITVGTNKAVGVFIADDANHPLKTTVTNTGTNVNVGNDSFGYVVDSTTGTDLILGSATNKLTSSLDTDSVYVYSNDKNGFVYSNTDITTNGGKIYGLYTAGRAENYGNMDLRGGTGNVGIYSTGTSPTGAGATNYGTITVGGTNLTAKEYGIGMATGYYNETTGAISNEGLIENRGTLNVVGDNSIGMYAVGSGSKAINAAGATIDISGKNATGMYIDHGAEGINYGTIKSTGSATGIKGVATVNGGYIKNYGTIAITSPDGIGIYQDAASSLANKNVPGNVSGTKKAVYTATSTDEKYIVSPKGSLLIQNPPRTPRLVVNGKEVELRGLDTNVASPTPSYVTAGVTTLDLSLPEFAEFKNSPSNAQASELGMYIDTSGVNYTNPIQGLNNLIGLDAINLIIGTEAAKYTDAKALEIGDNILTPYNNAISSLTTTGTKLNINAAGLTWLAQPVQGATKPIETLYMVKIPYTYFTSPKDENTYNFLDGLEQRYGVDGYGARGAREKLLFNKLNGIGKGETHIFTQAVDEMKGHQYANTQQRINETGSLLDEEFKYLHDEWRNPSKQNNKIKIFGIRNEYNTDTAGIIDYTSNAYGVAYVHEDETVKLGNSSGWYAGAVNNRFRFKDNGKSKENQTMLKAGIFKTMSPYMDHNGSLRWTVAGDVFVGQNEMKRRFLVVDDIFSAKGDYTSYGAAFKTDLGYDIRMSERTHLRPYGALKMEYGRFNNIKEDDGEMRLEVKGNDYFSVKPEVGVQFKYVQPLAVRTQLSIGLTAAYENELGKLQERRNQARVGYTDAGWYNLEQEKENRKGNGKFDFNLGVDNTRFGVTINAGYDTKGSNIRGGIGFRAIY